jgi:hypothetical protein
MGIGSKHLTLEEVRFVGGDGQALKVEVPLPEVALISGASVLPETYALLPTYPNPFNPEVHITYHLPMHEEVLLEVYGLTGQLVRILVRSAVSTGEHTVDWDGRDEEGRPVGSGIYLVRLRAGDFVGTRRMVLTR